MRGLRGMGIQESGLNWGKMRLGKLIVPGHLVVVCTAAS